MAKDMYQKRRERKENKINNTEVENKTNINWYPSPLVKIVLRNNFLID